MFNFKINFNWWKKQVPRAPRVKITALENCWFIYKRENLIQKFEVLNISTSGIAIKTKINIPFLLGQEYPITLNLGSKKINAGIKIVYVNSQLLGATFDLSNSKLTAEIVDYLKVQIAASGLKPVHKKFMDKEIRDSSLWLTDGRLSQIFFTTENDQIKEFQISFLGNHLNGGSGKALLLARAQEENEVETNVSWEPVNESLWAQSVPTLAEQFIQQVEGISEIQKKLLIACIYESQSIPPSK